VKEIATRLYRKEKGCLSTHMENAEGGEENDSGKTLTGIEAGCSWGKEVSSNVGLGKNLMGEK